MNHARYAPMISAYMDGELTPAERAELLAHVRECADCSALLDEYRRLRDNVRGLGRPAPPATLTAEVRRRATAASANQHLRWGGLACSVSGFLMASLPALVALLAAQVCQRRGHAS